ncbi:hypothetical protein HBA55_01930 [Pseudomaricurvus alkylphenolicus]|uniref:PilZ domain-containing protein n=1 Tax=Pseudomaricurvus alkylphenolicus TaxID=1306991 RepID=UPI0014210EA2|nr:PilZ domain-containing protein [Pseudomaricurvus alkylphenolicus]NIB38323.1 hypothetical protein [Pseudomaricurvus alkylphenolicus]
MLPDDPSSPDTLDVVEDNLHDHLPETSYEDEPRRNQRVDAFLFAETRSAHSDTVVSLINNLSYSGLQMEAGAVLVDALQSEWQSTAQPSRLIVSFHLDMPEEPSSTNEVKLHAEVVYIRDASDEMYRIGVEIVEIESGAEALVHFIEDAKL